MEINVYYIMIKINFLLKMINCSVWRLFWSWCWCYDFCWGSSVATFFSDELRSAWRYVRQVWQFPQWADLCFPLSLSSSPFWSMSPQLIHQAFALLECRVKYIQLLCKCNILYFLPGEWIQIRYFLIHSCSHCWSVRGQQLYFLHHSLQ